MKYNPELTKDKLKGTPLKNRVFIYNAEIILEFLGQTFMPTSYFLNSEGLKTISIGKEIKTSLLNNPKALQDHKMSLGDVYELYKIFRQQQPYTTPVESRYKFSVILKKMCFLKNGWQFHVRRHTRGQIIYLAPLLLRIHVPIEERREYIPGNTPPETPTVEVTPEDHEAEIPEAEYLGKPTIGVDPAYGEDKTIVVEGFIKQDGLMTVEKIEELPPSNHEPDGY